MTLDIGRNEDNSSTCYYFVDEAGDGNLFNKRGDVIIGNDGCSKYFILGVLRVSNPNELNSKLEVLRTNLLNDKYLKKIPSMGQAARKTVEGFHAKDDCPEVRGEVFRLLMEQEVKFHAAVKTKIQVLEYVNSRNENDQDYRYKPDELYDLLVRVLFQTLLHKDDVYEITFSKRGNKPRTQALSTAIEVARIRYLEKRQLVRRASVTIIPKRTKGNPCLQAIDYFLWALQRYYEKCEERYLDYIWSSVGLIHDLDDQTNYPSGEYYNSKNPLIKPD